MLFGEEGMGLEFQQGLVWRGIVEEGHFYRWRWDDEGVQFADLYNSYEEAVSVQGVLEAADEKVQEAWEGITIRTSEGKANGAWHYVSRSSSSC